ncbi:hypothetical protein DXG01_006081 [Tephrocybe rancida]|nr:hypothetical protein DXG01_006081 [Tephrocybe rancida]
MYGPIVRIAYEARKDPNLPENLLAMEGPAHTNRRRLCARGFPQDALADHDDVLVERLTELLNALTSTYTSSSTDLSYWIGLVSLDFIGDMAPDEGPDMLHNGCDTENIQQMINTFLRCRALYQTYSDCPSIQKIYIVKLRQSAVTVMRLVKWGSKRKKIWYHLSDEAGLEKTQPMFAMSLLRTL